MSRALTVLREERALLQRQLNALDAAITALSGNVEKVVRRGGRKGRKMSAATKAKIRASAKARWAKIKKA
jgi:hypothetical protein